jgi:hypothetical protein
MSASYMRRCAGKKRHETRENADNARAALCAAKALDVKQVNVYRCDQCLGWHTGRTGHRFFTRRRRSGKRPNKRLRGRV